MSLSGVILLIFVAAWAYVLVPMFLRRYDQASETAPATELQERSRVLARRCAAGSPALVTRAGTTARRPAAARSTPRPDAPSRVRRAVLVRELRSQLRSVHRGTATATLTATAPAETATTTAKATAATATSTATAKAGAALKRRRPAPSHRQLIRRRSRLGRRRRRFCRRSRGESGGRRPPLHRPQLRAKLPDQDCAPNPRRSVWAGGAPGSGWPSSRRPGANYEGRRPGSAPAREHAAPLLQFRGRCGFAGLIVSAQEHRHEHVRPRRNNDQQDDTAEAHPGLPDSLIA